MLLLQIAGGDEAAFRQLFEQYRERLFTFAITLTHSIVDAEEIVQDIFLKLWESRDTLPAIDHPEKYIYTMTRNRTLDHLARVGRNRKLVQQVWTNISQSDNGTEELLNARESQKLINKAVDQLSERKQQVFRLSKKEGYSLDEIAQELGLSKQTVKNTLAEALKQIKSYLSGHSELLAILFWIHYYSLLF